jgi:predicted acylesterase/phospholipase RssA
MSPKESLIALKMSSPTGEPGWGKTWKPEVLCLGAGGIKGLDELGAIWWFWLNGNLSNVHTYIGSSIGGIIGALMAMGWSPPNILEYAIDTSLFNDISEVQFTQVIHEFGLMSNSTFDDALRKRLADMIIKKLGKIPTLYEFHRLTGKRVIFTIVSLKEEKALYVDHNSHPDMNLMIALCSTSNTPLVFGKLEHQKDYLVDGAIIDPFPVRLLDDGRTPILAIGVRDQRAWKYQKMNAISYYERITSLPLRELTEFAIANASDQCYCILVPVQDEAGMLQMGTRESRLAKFLSGYHHTDQYVLSHPLRPAATQPKLEEPPLTPSAIKACFKSHAAKLIVRCMKENPALFNECLKEAGIEMPTHVEHREMVPVVQPDRLHEVSPVEHREMVPEVRRIVNPQSGQTYHPMVDRFDQDDDILELPPMRRQFPTFRPQRMPMQGIVITLNFDPTILDEIFHMMMGSVRQIHTLGMMQNKALPPGSKF